MSSECMPDKKARTAAYAYIKANVKKAQDLIDELDHPDDNPRVLEEIHSCLLNAAGEYGDGDYKSAADDLCEHYFS